jgi:hypothetical protein
MYASLPKNEFGKLGHTTVRYALHRLFVQRHGWYVKGLEPAGDSWNTTSPAGILKDRVSSEVIHLMEGRLDGHGFSLHETAVLAATLEHLVHDEALERLNKAYELQSLGENDHLDQPQSENVLDAYMKLYILPEDLAGVATDADMVATYPGWRETQDFVHDVQREVSRSDHGSKSSSSFKLMQNVVEEVGERFGRFQDAECRAMKDQLVALGDHGIGRVALADFYRPALTDDSFAFQESMDYLRELGALDDTDASSPSVIVPNYVNAPSNCIASSSFYSVCCLDECEQLMGHLESSIKAPEAPVATIVDLVSKLPSSTVEAPRTLQQSLLDRLDEVADAGVVTLHGRMFGQWMHHAFPRECPFPHVAGATAPRTPDEWMDSTGVESLASPEEMRKYVDQAAKSPSEVHPDGELGHWEVHEELLIPRAAPRERSGFADGFRKFMFVVVLLAMGVSAIGSGMKAVSSVKTGPGKAVFGKTKEHLV